MWPDRRLLDLLGIELPIIQAPMAGANGSAMAIAVSEAGGLGSLPCAMLDARQGARRDRRHPPADGQARSTSISSATSRPRPTPNAPPPGRRAWRPIYGNLAWTNRPSARRQPRALRRGDVRHRRGLKPEVVSFHFGLPEKPLLDRVKAAGCGRAQLRDHGGGGALAGGTGCDAIIAQGYEAGGHRGMFLTDDIATRRAPSRWCRRWSTP